MAAPADVPVGGTFAVWDYVVFSLVLAVSLSIGLYQACAGGRQRSTAPRMPKRIRLQRTIDKKENVSGTYVCPCLMSRD